MIDLRTEKQVKRDDRDALIAAYYNRLKVENPGVSQTRIIKAIAKEGKFGIKSPLAIRTALIKQNAITVSARS